MLGGLGRVGIPVPAAGRVSWGLLAGSVMAVHEVELVPSDWAREAFQSSPFERMTTARAMGGWAANGPMDRGGNGSMGQGERGMLHSLLVEMPQRGLTQGRGDR